MIRRSIARGAIIASTVVTSLGLAATVALAGDNNHNGQVDFGDTGLAVWCAQHVVHTYAGIGIGSGGEDSQFGSATRQGVRTYQARESLGIDGQVGPLTGHDMRSFVNALHRQAIQDHDNALVQDTTHWLNVCPTASSVFN
jgi:peptidoglycan hydrolase-like protein with peptidoglycan-binding domain